MTMSRWRRRRWPGAWGRAHEAVDVRGGGRGYARAAAESDSELEQYIEFSKSNIGIKYEDSIYTGLNKALIDGSTKLGYSIEDVYKDVEY